ncbi:MAG TPA: glycoside hydrolase family 11 protein [Verrucomicrobiae bacterium]|nr:glycoside hydrolase family 11 protein [Verrucomicrobiae bacterium]
MNKTQLFGKVLLVASALLMSTHQSNAAGSSGYHGSIYWFTYYTGSGSASLTGSGGNWRGTWTAGITDALTGKGWWPGSVRNVGYNCGQLSGNWHLLALYGWAPYNTREWYITDFGNNSGTSFGTINSDGGTYTVYRQIVSSTFQQYKNDRTANRSIGVNYTITMANHKNKWTSLGWSWGTVRETVMASEAFGGPGVVNCTVW